MKRKKRTKRICKWIASWLVIALLINASGIPILSAEETSETLESSGTETSETPESSETETSGTPESSGTETSGTPESSETETSGTPESSETETSGTPESSETETSETPENGKTDSQDSQLECKCTVRCEKENYNEDCPVCGTGDFEKCKLASQLECKCTVRCEKENYNEDCPVCGTGNFEKCKLAEEKDEPDQEAGDVDESDVKTQKELEAALEKAVADGESEITITLTDHISLTGTMNVPATANIVLDGSGFSLNRDGGFTDTMLYLNGNSSLTLKNICVDGQTVEAGSPAIVDYGNLILDKGAVVTGNSNSGTSQSTRDVESTDVANACGGGILVYEGGELTVTDGASVTKNSADKGGGVYLADGATLYLLVKDAIKDNKASEGANLYASSGSTIHYDSKVIGDIKQLEGFYISDDADLIDESEDDPATPDKKDDKVEIYINISEDSGYTKEDIAKIKSILEAQGYTIITSRTDINTTDLKDWYVYDHYDTGAWDKSAWKAEYGDENDPKRKYYPCTESYYISVSDSPVNTIAEWLERQDEYTMCSPSYGIVKLAQFKEHIYSRNAAGFPAMTFVGYGSPAYVDFLFYDPDSNGEKVVNFDVDSSQINTHTLAGSGFLVNTGVDGSGNLYGYLVYYAYTENTTTAASVSIYNIDGISADALHGGTYDLKYNRGTGTGIDVFGEPVATYQIPSGEWKDKMSIQINATPTSIEVRQQPIGSASDIDLKSPILSYNMSGSTYSGFGPLVAYTGHGCEKASSFTYSNLRMYFTNPELEKDMLSSLEKADFTQENTQKYFLNLWGNSESNYNDYTSMGQYQAYLEMMQREGIALITDKNTPFDEPVDYLGDNLRELDKGGNDILDVASLIQQIIEYIQSKTTTNMEDKFQQEDEDGLKKAEPQQSVGNIWLKDVSSGRQIKTINGNSLTADGVSIQPVDDISCYIGEGIKVKYEVIKPNGTVKEYPDYEPGSPPMFTVTNNRSEWPAGQYIVRQTIGSSSVQGHSYFEIQYKDTTVPDDTQKYTISVSVDGEGTIFPNGTNGKVYVRSGATQWFVIIPDDGYQIDAVLVDEDQEPVTLENANPLYLMLSGIIDIEINVADPVALMSENDIATIDLLTDDEDDNTVAKQYVFENVTSNHTLSVKFIPIPKESTNGPTASTSDSSPNTPDSSTHTPVSSPNTSIGSPIVQYDAPVIPEPVVTDSPEPASKDSEPKTGSASTMEIYVTIGMIVGLSYLLFYFADGEGGMTEEEKKEIIETLLIWAGRGKWFRKYIAMAIIFMVLAYYHSIGKRITKKWKELCE